MRVVLLSVVTLALMAPLLAGDTPVTMTGVLETPTVGGAVNWTDGVARAIGIGAPPAQVRGPQAAVLARRAALLDARRNLLEVIQGVRISSTTTVRNAMTEDDVITSSVQGFIRGARVVREETRADGAVLVEVAVALYGGAESLAGRLELPERLASVPEPPNADLAAPPAVQGNYTGLLIDCRGVKLAPAMCPKILDVNGAEVWGRVEVTNDVLLEKGLAGYYPSVERALELGRVGRNPLIIRAARAAGNGQFPTDAVVSLADARRILAEDAATHFLRKLAVGFVVE
ncbi:MAG TPA: LPP20 family lipoprotein [Armatimonadota bacterium]|nr:LPP20 family lipoprotein [Armatimonadota bacterium]